jgi:predicted metalloprotease with PDZ domain
LSDDVYYPAFMLRQAVPWRDWQRRRDYYSEGVMLWLDVDAILRERSRGKRSLDDFARAFLGIHDGSRVTLTYTFDDVCDALNAIVPHDWRAYFRHRLDTHDDDGVLDGLRRDGYRLVFTDTPTDSFRQSQGQGIADLTYSIGLVVGQGGLVRNVAWQGPAFRAGLSPGAQLVSINGQPYAHAALEAAVKDSSNSPLALEVESEGRRSSVRIDYHGTLRYPRLERVPGTPDGLVKVLAPLVR